MKMLSPSELPNSEPISCFLYGQPGVGKTTFALSAPNPLLLDFEHGLKRVAKQFQTTSVQVESWNDMRELMQSDLSKFDSIVIDTLGAVIDSVFDYVCELNPKLKSATGTPTTQGWGAIKNVVLGFHKELLKLGKNVIYIAHDKEVGADDSNQRVRPDAAGSSYREIIKQTDIVGYMSMRANRRTICFTPTDEFIAKNSLGLAGYIEIPTTQLNNNFFSKILEDLKDKRAQENAERVEYDKLLAQQDEILSHVETSEDLFALIEAQKEQVTKEIWGSKSIMWCKIKQLAKDKFNLVYDNDSKQFKNVNNA